MSTHDDISQSNNSAGDLAPGLFVPDLLLASQQGGRGVPDSPSRRLVVAVLERALLDVVGSAREADRNDALAWFRSDDDAPFSFRWVAHHLGIEAGWLRSRIEARRRRPAATSPAAPPIPASPAVDGRRAA